MDKDTARLLAIMFTDRGIGVWFDQWEIKPGDSITGGIAKGIEECDVFMLMWSAAAKASKWVDTELRAGIRKRVDDTGFRLIAHQNRFYNLHLDYGSGRSNRTGSEHR
jgi:hypothetical protein